MEVVAAAPSAQSLLRTAADRIDAVVALLLGPFGTLLEQLTSVYRHYRAQGKAAVFLLTVAGLVAFTAGFGYLLQYSFNSFLGPIAKLAIGFLSGTAIIGLGAFLFRRNPRMQDYASAIIGLGVVVLYLCAYFTGPYYGLTDAAGSFALFAGAVAAGYFLALIFETRVVAVITLAGGIASPWTLTDPNAIADSYALFLALLTLGSLHLGQRIRWVALSRFVFVSTALVLEYLALESSTQPAILMAAMHAHLYLFFYYLLFQGRTLVDRPDRVALTMLAAEIALVILIASQVIGDATMLGAVLGANAVVLGAPFFMRFTRGGDARVVFLLAAGALLGYGILAIFSLDYLGLLWGIEAVALLYVGLRFASVSIRVEGMLLLGLSAVSSTYAGSIWLIGSGWSLAPPWVSLVGLVVYLEAFGRLLRGGYALSAIEQRIPRWLDEVEAVIGALVWAGLVLVLRPDLLAVAAIAPLFAMLYFASLRKLHLAQAFALAHMGFFVYAVVDAGQSLGNFYFTDQPLIAQLVRLELLATLWLLQAFYERFYPDVLLARWSRPLRQLVYLILPMVFLPQVSRDYAAYLPLAVWGSCSIAWLLYRRIGSAPLRIETMLLTVVSSVFTLACCASDYLGYTSLLSYWALGAGLAFFLVVLVAEGGFASDAILAPLARVFATGFFYLGGAILAAVFALSESFMPAALVTAAYFTALVSLGRVLAAIRGVLMRCYQLAEVLVVAQVVVSLVAPPGTWQLIAMNAAALALWGYLIHLRSSLARLGHMRSGGMILQQWLWHGAIVLGYMAVIARQSGDLSGPAMSICLVLHATTILFLTLQSRWARLIRLAVALFVVAGVKIVFYDMAGFSVVEKIIALMIIGALLLGAAYWFQQLRDRAASSA